MVVADVKKRWEHLQNSLQNRLVEVIAVTKFHSPEVLQICYELGIKHVGESRPQEMVEKFSAVPQLQSAFQKHFVGNLQRNKIKYLTQIVDSFDSVANLQTIKTIEQQFEQRSKRQVEILLQINSTNEPQKNGILVDDLDTLKNMIDYCGQSKTVVLTGIMSMGPTPSNDPLLNNEATKVAFAKTAQLFANLKNFAGSSFQRLSMGMSNDYILAVQEGSTEIRIGSLLFGERQ